MATKRKKVVSTSPEKPRPNDDWVVATEMQLNGRHVAPGTELKISGERGRFRFIKHVINGDSEWIDVFGGPKGSETWRSFRTERVKTVHYKNQTTTNLAIQYKAKKKELKKLNASKA